MLADRLKKYYSFDLIPVRGLSKTPPMLSKKYFDWIKTQPCIISGQLGSDGHHVIYKSQSKNDYSAVPLLRKYHNELHDHKHGVEGFEEDYSVNLNEAIIAKLMEYIYIIENE